jgi:hypothetical protein
MPPAGPRPPRGGGREHRGEETKTPAPVTNVGPKSEIIEICIIGRCCGFQEASSYD